MLMFLVIPPALVEKTHKASRLGEVWYGTGRMTRHSTLELITKITLDAWYPYQNLASGKYGQSGLRRSQST